MIEGDPLSLFMKCVRGLWFSLLVVFSNLFTDVYIRTRSLIVAKELYRAGFIHFTYKKMAMTVCVNEDDSRH